jgi:hypothetical protein
VSGDWDPIGLAASPTFQAYVAALRSTASFSDPADSSENGFQEFHMAISSDSYDDPFASTDRTPDYGRALAALDPAAFTWLDSAELFAGVDRGLDSATGRRGFMIAAGAAAVTAAAGPVAAQDAALNYETDMTPDPRILGAVTVDEVGPDMGMLEFINDADDVEDLADYGGMLAADDDDSAAYNPVQFDAGAGGVDADTFGAFPRGEMFDESGDGDAETDISALDSTHWSTDESSTAGTISVADSDSDGGVSGLQISTSSQTSGDTAVASLDSQYVSIADSIDQRVIQLGVDVTTLESATVVEIVFTDSNSNTVTVSIDDGLTLDDSDVVADGTGSAYVFQAGIGDIAPGTLDDIDSVKVKVKDGNADVTFFWIDVERTEKLSFGTEEYENTDGDYETRTVYEPQGAYSVQDLGGLDDAFDGATLYSVQYDAEFRVSEALSSWVDFQFEEAGRYDRDLRFQTVQNIDLPTAFDLSWSLDDFVVDQSHPSSRYLTVEVATESEAQTLDDTGDDTSTSWTGRTGRFDGAIGDTVELSGAPSASDVEAVHYDVLVDESEREEMTAAAGGGGGGPAGGGDGGILDFVTSLPGMIATGLVSALGLRRLGIIGGS